MVNYRFESSQIPREDGKETDTQIQFHDLNNPGSVFPLTLSSDDLTALYQFLQMKLRNKQAILPASKSPWSDLRWPRESSVKAETLGQTLTDGVLLQVDGPVIVDGPVAPDSLEPTEVDATVDHP